MSFAEKLRLRLDKTRKQLFGRLNDLFRPGATLDASTWESLEEILITADIGVSTSHLILDKLKKRIQKEKSVQPHEIRNLLEDELIALLSGGISGQLDDRVVLNKPYVILMVGVNGTGKTTTIGKLAGRFSDQGLKVLMVAADTFRAAASDQLGIWADRASVEIVHSKGGDPSALIFDAMDRAKSRVFDVVLVDTAGRMHTKVNLMEELKKMRRVIEKQIVGAPHETILVLDGTTGQNAAAQAQQFAKACPLTGLIVTKLDGTAKGGVLVSIQQDLGVPIYYVGVGESLDDLIPFNAEDFVKAVTE